MRILLTWLAIILLVAGPANAAVWMKKGGPVVASSGYDFPEGTYAFLASQTSLQAGGYIANDADITDNTIGFYYRVKITFTPFTNLGDGEAFIFTRFEGARGTSTVLSLTNDSGVFNVRFGYYEDTGWAAKVSDGAPVDVDTTYVIEVKAVDGATPSWELKLDGVSIDDSTNHPNETIQVLLDELMIGSEIAASSPPGYTLISDIATSIYMDCVDLDSTGWLGTDCSNTGDILSETFEADEYDLGANWVESGGGVTDGNSTGP